MLLQAAGLIVFVSMPVGQSSFAAPNPNAEPKAVIIAGHAKFTVLTPAMIRMEWSAKVQFEDRASFAFVNRRLEVPEFTTARDGDWTVIKTQELTLRYRADGGRFSKDNLSVELQCAGKAVKWAPGMPDTGNLRGTTRTLDGVSGSCALEPGLLSRDGWAIVDDSKRLLFDNAPSLPHADATAVGMAPTSNPVDNDQPWVATRNDPDAIDWYFFGYGHDYKRALFDFTRVGGKIPLPPRFVFGAWWSRYWAYSDAELRQLVDDFEGNSVPLDVLVVDMDWHLDGWTGYTWNPKYFPDPKGFLDWAHEKGLKVTLNLHPADGVGKQEAAFPEFAKAMGLDPAKTEKIPFDCTDRKYMNAYFKLLHHPLEKMGVDFWWLDWQQGTDTKIAGLDPLFWLNHLHWNDMARNPARRVDSSKIATTQGATAVSAVQSTSQASTSPSTRTPEPVSSPRESPSPQPSPSRERESRLRPLIFSRWGGLGNHRYPIGFSGDTYSNWESLAFQPYFTATAGNVGYAYWSHDIGGHMPGRVEPELYVRWIQWGALSPILRTHTTKNPEAERRIWEFPEEYFGAAWAAYQLRYELLPYIYTMARKTYDTGLPLCRPLYYEWPELDEAYSRTGQYMFGDDLLVVPVTEPGDPMTGCANVEVWIPPGKWINWFTSRTYAGPTIARLLVPLEEIPLFVREGAIQAIDSGGDSASVEDARDFEIDLFPGSSGSAVKYDDDGESIGYQTGAYLKTPIAYERKGNELAIQIGPTEGSYIGCETERNCSILVRATGAAEKVTFDGKELDPPPPGFFEGACSFYSPSVFGFSNFMQLPFGSYEQRHEAVLRFSPDWNRDEQLIRGGLMGRIYTLSNLVGHSDRYPELPKLQAASGDATYIDDKDWKVESRRLLNQLPSILKEIKKSKLKAREKARLAIRLLGLWHRLNSGITSVNPTTIESTLMLAPTVPLGSYSDAKGVIRFQISPGVTNRDQPRKFEGLAEDMPIVEKIAIALGGDVQTMRLRANVRLTKRNDSVEFPLRQTLFPSINHWWVVGPFEATFEKGLATEYPPEGEKEFDATAKYDGKDGKKIEWKRVSRAIKVGDDPTTEHFVDLNMLYESPGNAVAYGLTYLNVPVDTSATLAVGSDDGAAMWLNGVEIYRQDVGRAYMSKQDRVKVMLRKGMNPLLIKVKQGSGGWGFCVHVENEKGDPLPEVKAVLEQ